MVIWFPEGVNLVGEHRYGIMMPGQLFEREGMARALVGHPVFERIAGGFNVMTEGRFEHWVTTAAREEISGRFTAPSVMVLYGCLCAEIAKEDLGPPAAVCGYSLGFYAAAVFAHSITVQTALGWLGRVNAFNARDFPEGRFGVAVSTGLSKVELEKAFRDWALDGLFVSNVNNSRQMVFAGPKRLVTEAAERLEKVALSVQEAPLDIPLHTPYMDGARREVEGWWSTIPAASPACELISPVDGALVRSGRALKREMLTSLASPTDWVAVVKTLDELDLEWVLDLSPGGELGRMARWTKRDMDIRPASCLWEGRG